LIVAKYIWTSYNDCGNGGNGGGNGVRP